MYSLFLFFKLILRRKMKVEVGAPKNRFNPPPPQWLLLAAPRRYLRCISFMFGAVQFLNVLILTLLCVQLFNSEKVTELPPV